MLSQYIYKSVRLKPQQLDVIINAFADAFLATDHLWILVGA